MTSDDDASSSAASTAPEPEPVENTAINNVHSPNYRGEYKRFIEWLENQGCRPDEHGRWITQGNVHLYWRLNLARERSGNHNTLMRIGSAIEWYARNREYPKQELPFPIKCALFKRCVKEAESRIQQESSTIDNSLRASSVSPVPVLQQPTTTTSSTRRKKVPDPHKGLKDILPDDDREAMADHILRERHDWSECMTAFNLGNNTMLRGASTRKIVWCDLNLSRGYGHERTGPLSRCLMIVLRRGPVHKQRRDTDQQVGMYRHRNYKFCSVLSLAMNVIYRLHRDETINFLHENKYY